MTTQTQEKTEATNIDALLNDPDKLPTDPNELAAMFENTGMGESDNFDPAGDPENKPDASAAATDGQQDQGGKKESQPGEAPAAGTEKAEGVLAKDGKHIIPYAVLESSRQREAEAVKAREEAERREQEARRLLNEAQARADRLTEETRRREAGDETGQEINKDQGTSDEIIGKLEQSTAALEKLAEETPALAELFAPLIEANRASVERLHAMQQRLDRVEARAQDEDARSQSQAKATVQEAIDANPVLRYWQAEDQEMWNRAARFEMRMRGLNEKGERVSDPDPDYIELPIDKRFDFVVKTMESRYGPVTLPEKFRPATSSNGSESPPSKPAPAGPSESGDIKARAEAKLNEVEGKQKPMTLSDLPGGAPPTLGDKRLEEMSLAETELRLNKMLDQGMSIQDIVSQYG